MRKDGVFVRGDTRACSPFLLHKTRHRGDGCLKSRKGPSPEPCQAGTLTIDAQNLELGETYLFVAYKPLSLWFSIKAHRTY